MRRRAFLQVLAAFAAAPLIPEVATSAVVKLPKPIVPAQVGMMLDRIVIGTPGGVTNVIDLDCSLVFPAGHPPQFKFVGDVLAIGTDGATFIAGAYPSDVKDNGQHSIAIEWYELNEEDAPVNRRIDTFMLNKEGDVQNRTSQVQSTYRHIPNLERPS